MSGRVQGSRQNILNTFYNQNAGNASAWLYVPDLSRPAYYDRTWENYTPRITWQASSRNKISFSWDEQYVCRKCTGTASFSGSPAPNTSPEADGKGEFSPQRVQSGRWTSPLSNRLLLEAGFGTTYYQWAGKENDPNPTHDLVRVVGQNTPVLPGSAPVTVTYRSQNWYENYTRGSNWAAAANYVTGSHSVKVGYQGNYWRDDREHVRQHHEHGVHVPRRGSELDHDVRERLSGEGAARGRTRSTCRISGPSVASPCRAPSATIIRGAISRRRPSRQPFLPRRVVRASRRRDRLQRHHAALRRRL
jgi:hypothetical protein